MSQGSLGVHLLPLRRGVAASCVVLPSPPRGVAMLLDGLAQRLPGVTWSVWQHRLQQGEVFDAQGQPVPADSPWLAGQRLYYYRDVPDEAPLPTQAVVLYQDEHIVVADKPHFMPVVPSGPYLHNTLLVRLRQQLQLSELSPVHRIDRDTAGLVLLCVQAKHRNAYQTLFRQRMVHKVYWAFAPWRGVYAYPLCHQSRIVSDELFFRCKESPGEYNAQTTVDVLSVNGDQALYELTPVTGQRHQLRVHMQALGMPICNDAYYPIVNDPPAGDYSRPLQLLARELAFQDPLTGVDRYFCSQQQLLMADTAS